MSVESLIELHRRGDHQGVLRLARSIDVQPTADPQSALVVAASLFQLGRFRDALQICLVLQPVVQTDLSFLNLFALCLRRLDQVAQAEQVFRFGLEHHPASTPLTTNYVNLLLDQHRLDEAQALLQQGLEARPAATEFREHLARIEELRARPLLPAVPTPTPPSETHQPSLRLPASSEEVAVSESSGVDSQPKPPRLLPSLDPLLQAFSDEEVRLDQENRRRLRESKAEAGVKPVTEEVLEVPAVVSLPELPEPPLAEVVEELHVAAREALMEKQPEAALVLADQLRLLDPSMQVEIYRICAEAYLAMANPAAAELCLHAIGEHGQLCDEDHLNLALLSLRRHDLHSAERHLNAVVDRQLHQQHLDAIRLKLEGRVQQDVPMVLFSVKGIKPVRTKHPPASQPAQAGLSPAPQPTTRSKRP